MKKCISFLLIFACFTYSFSSFVYADTSDLQLYAKYAVLMDSDSKRILYGKNEDTPAPMASTTKIMTCIIALEYGMGELSCTTSSYAASMPDVQLNAKKGEIFLLNDLLYSLMLKSHNDSAVIIAENVACFYIYQIYSGTITDEFGILNGKNLDCIDFSSGFDTSFLQNITTEQSKVLVSIFTGLMNAKAETLGCTQTHFITPNGLDASDEYGIHSTTAKELAIIMSYCIENEDFLKITQTKEYSFGSYSFTNANAFFNMYDNIISGKTGFTGNAGYCYTCAYRCDEKTFIVTLLACGWPPHKTYKWQDSRTLLNFGKEHFHYEDIINSGFSIRKIAVYRGTLNCIPLSIHETYGLLLCREDIVNVVICVPDIIKAPVSAGDIVGCVNVYINDELTFSTPVYADTDVEYTGYLYFLYRLIKSFCFIDK